MSRAAAVHEAAHAVAARLQNVDVIHAVAAGDCGVWTRWRRPATKAATFDVLEALTSIDLAGRAAEQHYLDEASRDEAWETDERNASGRVTSIIHLRHDLAADAELTAAQCAEADAVLADLRDRAQALIETSGPAIQRVAVALAAGKPLAQDQIDAAIAGRKRA